VFKSKVREETDIVQTVVKVMDSTRQKIPRYVTNLDTKDLKLVHGAMFVHTHFPF